MAAGVFGSAIGLLARSSPTRASARTCAAWAAVIWPALASEASALLSLASSSARLAPGEHQQPSQTQKAGRKDARLDALSASSCAVSAAFSSLYFASAASAASGACCIA